jgi:hypothetical protein
LSLIALYARENPFFPDESIESMPITSNQIQKYPLLNRAAISLPDQARVLEEITISYKNLDGSIEKKSIQVNRSVDWHIPLFISQSYATSDEKVMIHSNPKTEQRVDFDFINFQVSEKTIQIKTDDKLRQNFLLVNPHRIVLDFEREANFLSYKKTLKTVPFTQLRLGNHDGYYRVVITLDGRYRYELESTHSGYRIQIL